MSQTNDLFAELAQKYIENVSSDSIIDIITFATAPWGLNVNLYPSQKFILKTFYGMELDGIQRDIIVNDDVNEKELYKFSEKEFMQYLIDEGRTNLKEYIPGKSFSELILCCGRRSSKSSMSAIIANYEAYKLLKKENPQKYYGLLTGQEIRITAVSISDDDATGLFEMIFMRSLNCDYLKTRMPKPGTQTYCVFQTDYDINNLGKKATIRIQCGGSSANSLRGKNNIIVIFDEAAFFIDNSNRYSGQEVYNALTPSTATFTNPNTKRCDGKVLTLSSPYSKSGVFWDLYNQSFREPERTLMFKMYTSMLNPHIDPEYLKSKKRANRESFNREFGAEFSDNIASWLDEYELKKLDEFLDKTRTVNLSTGKHGVEYFYGIDLGQKNDGIAISIVHKENSNIILDYTNVWFGSESDIWDYRDSIYRNCKEFSGYDIIPIMAVAEKIKSLCQYFPPKSGWFDQWSGYALDEQLKARNIYAFRPVAVSEGLNMQIFNITKSLITDGILKLFNHPVLISEIQALEIERHSGKFKVHAPSRPGFHDDITTSLSRAVYECHNHYKDNVQYASIAFNKNGVESNAKNANEYFSYLKKRAKQHGGIYEKRNINIGRNRI